MGDDDVGVFPGRLDVEVVRWLDELDVLYYNVIDVSSELVVVSQKTAS